jgi:hypothetical protein
VVVPFRGVDQTFQFYHRSLWDWAIDLLQDPEVGPHFVFDAQQLSKFDGEKFVRFIHEPWTANMFWEYQVCVNCAIICHAHVLIEYHNSQKYQQMPNHLHLSCMQTRPNYHRSVVQKAIL